MAEAQSLPNQLELTVDIISAFVTKNHIPPNDLPALIDTVHATLRQLANGNEPAPAQEAPHPAVPIKRSITDEYMVCLEDGEKFKSLKRHLRTAHHLSPDEYRAKWGLAPDYPMVAPAYAVTRSNLARSMGFGQQRRKAIRKAEPAPAPEPPVRRGRGRSSS